MRRPIKSFLIILGLALSTNFSIAQKFGGHNTVQIEPDLDKALVQNDRIYIKYTINAGETLNLALLGGSSNATISRTYGTEDFIAEYDQFLSFRRTYRMMKDLPNSTGTFRIQDFDVSPNGKVYALMHVSGDVDLELTSGLAWRSAVGQSQSDGMCMWDETGAAASWWSKAQSYTSKNVIYYAHSIVATDTGAFVAETYFANSTANPLVDIVTMFSATVNRPIWGSNTPSGGFNNMITFYPYFGGRFIKWETLTNSSNAHFGWSWQNLSFGGVPMILDKDNQGNIVAAMNIKQNAYSLPSQNASTSLSGINNQINGLVVFDANLNDLRGYSGFQRKGYDRMGRLWYINGNSSDLNYLENGMLNLNDTVTALSTSSNQYEQILIGYDETYIMGPQSSSSFMGTLIRGVDKAGNFGTTDTSYLYTGRFSEPFESRIQIGDGTVYAFYKAKLFPNQNDPINLTWIGYKADQVRSGTSSFRLDSCKLAPTDVPLTRRFPHNQAIMQQGYLGAVAKYSFDSIPDFGELDRLARSCDSVDVMNELLRPGWIHQGQICMVTVDDGGENTVVWNWPKSFRDTLMTERIVKTYIYREKGASNFDVIDSIGPTGESIYVDNDPSVNSRTTSFKYKIRHQFDYGRYSNRMPESDYHKTMHLTANKGLNGEANLIWDAYEGQTTPYYFIYRDTSQGFVLIDSVVSTNFTYSDFDTPKQHQARYRINSLDGVTCTASARRGATFVGSFSNEVQIEFATSKAELKRPSSRITVYPNPGQGEVSFRWTYHQSDRAQLYIRDLLGKTVYKEQLLLQRGINEQQLDLNELNSGVYLLSIESEGGFRVMEKITIK